MTVERRLGALEIQGRRWRRLCMLQTCFVLVLLVLLMARSQTTAQADDGILRARGLIISDANGKSRILLGAPFPETKDRIRQDDRTAAMIFLDEQGHDRLTLGEETAAQMNGVVPKDKHRISPGYAYLIHDLQGNERGGMGFLSIGRAVVGLDRPNGDAWSAMVDDKNGFAGTLSIYDRNVGDGAEGIFSGTQGKRAFITMRGLDDEPRGELSVGPAQKASFILYNEQGKDGKDVFESLPRPKP